MICRICSVDKPDDRFYVRKETGRRRRDCVDCHKARGRTWALSNVDRRRAIALKYARANMDKIAAWKKANQRRAKKWDREHPDEVRAMKAKWSKNNPEKVLADVRHRQTKKLLATPPWSDRKEIEAIYAEARRRGHEVDHIVPLRSKIVCGLHVPANLAIIPQAANRSKGNRHWSHMP